MPQDVKLIITGIDAYDGEYDFPLDLTNGEWHTIKRLTGLRRGEVVQALETDDTDLPVAYAVIALQRAGKYVDEEILWGAGPDSFTTNGVFEETEEDKLPPVTGAVLPSGGAENRSASTPSGGSDSETSQTAQNGTGQGSSEPSPISGQPI